MPEIIGHYITIDGTRVYFEECGEGIPLVCLHSASACSSLFFDFLQIIASYGLRAVAIDLPGHGKSLPVNWQPFRILHQQAEFIWKVIKAITRAEKAIILGTATGGNMAIDLAANHSSEIRAVICCEGAARTPTFPNVHEYEDPHACPGWRNIMERAALAAVYHPMAVEKVVELRWLHRYCAQESATGDLECWFNHDSRAGLKNVTCPVLIFRGEADFYVPDSFIEETIQGLPDGLGEYVVGKKMGHYPTFEQPIEAAKIFLNFLKIRKVIN